jgi:hypothetical protein
MYYCLLCNKPKPRHAKKTNVNITKVKQEINYDVATPLWGKCEDETRTPKSGNLESFGTPATSELDCRGQNTSPWSILYTIGKALKCRWNGIAWAIWTSGAQVMVKIRAGSQTGNLTPDHKKYKIDPIPVCADGVQHTVGKLLRRDTSLL